MYENNFSERNLPSWRSHVPQKVMGGRPLDHWLSRASTSTVSEETLSEEDHSQDDEHENNFTIDTETESVFEEVDCRIDSDFLVSSDEEEEDPVADKVSQSGDFEKAYGVLKMCEEPRERQSESMDSTVFGLADCFL